MTIVGRKDDMIISGGENVHPTQVEAVLTEHPDVADAAVVGLPDERWGELVVAYVVPESDPARPLDAAALEAHTRDHPMLAGYKRPRLYRFVDALPMTATGKKVHYRVRELAAEDAAAGRLTRPGAMNTRRRPSGESGRPRMSDPVITGIGALTPLARNAPDTWTALVAGRSGVTAVEGIDLDGVPVHVAGQVHGFDAEAELGPKKSRRTARFAQLAIVAAREAVADAGLEPAGEADRTAVVINSAVSGWPEIEDNVTRMIEQGPRELSPFLVSTSILNMPACEVAIDLGAHGPVNASALACASGTYALLEARRLIATGEADVVICGGTDAGICRSMFAALALMGPLSESTADPATVSRPFDADRNGFVFGEGTVVFVVESAAHAAARGARAYAALAGGALTSDAFHMAAPEPTGTYAGRAIDQALRNASVAPDELDYICGHGTSTRANDVAETKAIRMALGDAADHVPVSSPKSMVGHLIGAAGALSVMACVYAMRDGVLPPTINLDTPDPECDLDYVPNVAREARVRTAAANAFGFGGQNCVVVVRAV